MLGVIMISSIACSVFLYSIGDVIYIKLKNKRNKIKLKR